MDWRAAAWAGGHIPYWLPLPLGELLTDDGRLTEGHPPLFEQWGPRPQETVDL